MREYRGWRVERLIGSKLGRRGGAARRFGFLATSPDGATQVFPPTSSGGVSLTLVHRTIDLLVAGTRVRDDHNATKEVK